MSFGLEQPSAKQKQKKDDTISDSTGKTATLTYVNLITRPDGFYSSVNLAHPWFSSAGGSVFIVRGIC